MKEKNSAFFFSQKADRLSDMFPFPSVFTQNGMVRYLSESMTEYNGYAKGQNMLNYNMITTTVKRL